VMDPAAPGAGVGSTSAPTPVFTEATDQSSANSRSISPLLLSTALGPQVGAEGESSLSSRKSFVKSPARRRNSKKAASITTATAAASIAADSSAVLEQFPVKVRPTEPVRTGYLLKLDASAMTAIGSPSGGIVSPNSRERDAWLPQYVTLDISTGLLTVFAEINA
jgi:hypothetical protein